MGLAELWGHFWLVVFSIRPFFLLRWFGYSMGVKLGGTGASVMISGGSTRSAEFIPRVGAKYNDSRNKDSRSDAGAVVVLNRAFRGFSPTIGL